MWVIAAHLKDVRAYEEIQFLATVEQSPEALDAAISQSLKHSVGMADFWVKWIIQEALQVPTQFTH
jgi:hypothetical protein